MAIDCEKITIIILSQKLGENFKIKRNRRIYLNITKIKSIIKNRKLIYNIDINCETQGSLIQENENYIK